MLIDYTLEDENTIYVYMVYDENNTLVNVYNEYMEAIDYCISELDGEGQEIDVNLFEYCAYIDSSRGCFTVVAEILITT